MLDKNGVRQLCYLVWIDDIEPIVGSDNCEAAIVGGWKVMVRKGTFQPEDMAIYFEIDSHVDTNKPEFAFLEKKHGNIKTQKYTFGGKNPGFYSQGLLMSIKDFGWHPGELERTDGTHCLIAVTPEGEYFEVGDFLTERLGVTYYEQNDIKRKATNSDLKINSVLNRHPKIAKKYGKFIKKHKIIKWLFLILFGRKKDNKTAFPTKFSFVKKSDEERCENMPWILENKTPFVKTTKIDGTSTLFVLERKPFNKREFYVCSRNVRQLTPNQKTYHSDNVYWSVEFKYHIKDFLEDMLKQHPDWNYVALQGETAGVGEDGGKIQGDPHNFGELRFFGYNFIDPIKGRWGSIEAKKLVSEYKIEWVPIVDENYILPDNFEEFKLSADGPCEAPGASGMREGYVYRNINNPNLSFKNVSRNYLLKH